jgi:hypothetical protein
MDRVCRIDDVMTNGVLRRARSRFLVDHLAVYMMLKSCAYSQQLNTVVFGFFILDRNVLLGDDESSPWAMQRNYWFKKRGMLSPFHGLVCMSNELWRKNQVKIRPRSVCRSYT